MATVLVTRPDVLVLDEPTNGMDPLSVRKFRELIAELAAGVGGSGHLASDGRRRVAARDHRAAGREHQRDQEQAKRQQRLRECVGHVSARDSSRVVG